MTSCHDLLSVRKFLDHPSQLLQVSEFVRPLPCVGLSGFLHTYKAKYLILPYLPGAPSPSHILRTQFTNSPPALLLFSGDPYLLPQAELRVTSCSSTPTQQDRPLKVNSNYLGQLPNKHHCNTIHYPLTAGFFSLHFTEVLFQLFR